MNLNHRRRLALQFSALSLALAATVPVFAHGDDASLRSGKVFTSTNAPGGNGSCVGARTFDGRSRHARMATCRLPGCPAPAPASSRAR